MTEWGFVTPIVCSTNINSYKTTHRNTDESQGVRYGLKVYGRDECAIDRLHTDGLLAGEP